MKWPVLLTLLAAASLQGAPLPVGTEVQVRLTTPVSSAKTKPGDPVRVTVIAPVVIDGSVSLPAGTELQGTVAEAKPSAETTAAELVFRFTTPLRAHVASLDNARETVDAQGKITGILGKETFSGRLDQGLTKLQANSRLAGLAGILQGARQTLNIQEADPEITLPAGAEFTVVTDAAFTWTGVDTSPFSRLKPIANTSELGELVNRQPFRTNSQKPPRPSDLTNVMFIGTEEQIRDAFERAGWSTAAKLSSESKMETARAIIEARGYKEGPMSVLLLDGNPPDMVYQKTSNTFAARHHLRIFRRPDRFAGLPVWVCSSTHDTGIDYSESERTFIHKIDSNIDKERAKVVSDLVFTGLVSGLALVERPSVPRDASNATGDALTTDGQMAVLQLSSPSSP